MNIPIDKEKEWNLTIKVMAKWSQKDLERHKLSVERLVKLFTIKLDVVNHLLEESYKKHGKEAAYKD